MNWIYNGVITTLITFVLGTILYFIGAGITKKAAVKNIAIGFVTYTGLLELIGFGFVAWRGSKIAFTVVSVVLLIILLIITYKAKVQWKGCIKSFRPYAISVLVTFLLIALTFIYCRLDADDSFYVSNVALFQNSNILNGYDSSFGIEALGTVPMYDFQIWESLMALVSSLFHVEGAAMMHTYIIPLLLIVSASAYIFLGETLCEDKRQANLFYVGMSIFHLFGGYAIYSEGSFLLSRLWQGKAVYLTVVLPVMIAVILKETKQNNRMFWAKLLICILSGIALNPTSLYVLGFQLLFMMIAVAVFCKKPKSLLQCIPSVICVALFTLLIYLRTSRFSGQIEASSQTGITFVKDTFLKFFGEGKLYLIIYIICICIVVFLGTKRAKLYLIATPVFMLLTIWNPIVGRYVAETVTKVPSYWRVFWLIPIGPTICYALILLWKKVNLKTVKGIILIIGILSLSVPGKWMFTQENRFFVPNNPERIPDEVVVFGEQILELNDNPIVLGCDHFATTLRQKYTDIELVYSRPQYIKDLFLYRGEAKQYEERVMMRDFTHGQLKDMTDILSLLNEYNVDFVAINAAMEKEITHLEKHNWVRINSMDNYVLLQNQGE